MNQPQKTRISPMLPDMSEEIVRGLSRYEMVHKAGQGSMGVVYRARHKSLEMDVAIKLLQGGRPTDRFMREAKLLAKIRSPYVVRVHDLDQMPDGAPMLVMEWIDGLDLQRTMETQGGRVPESQAILWMKHVCEGMMVAASEGIVHRDLKPSNVIIDREGKAKVADFGLAFVSAAHDLTITTDGARIMGSVYYMSPEQAEDPRSADTRSDIYSFGAMFYHALTGVPPFEGDSPFVVLLKHKLDPLVSPKARYPDLTEATTQLLERCLAKSPNDRFQSFAEVLKNLNREASELAWAVHQDDALAPCLARFDSRLNDYLVGRISEAGEVYDFPGGGELRIIYGSIVQQQADVIVSSDNSHLRMSYGVSLDIRLSAGEHLLAEAQHYAPVRPGRVVVTSAGNLKARFIFHGVTIGWADEERLIPSRDLIVEIIKSCFYHADTLNVRSIAFPLLGTGAAGFPRDVCLETMFRYLARTLHSGLSSVRKVTLVLYGRPALTTEQRARMSVNKVSTT